MHSDKTALQMLYLTYATLATKCSASYTDSDFTKTSTLRLTLAKSGHRYTGSQISNTNTTRLHCFQSKMHRTSHWQHNNNIEKQLALYTQHVFLH